MTIIEAKEWVLKTPPIPNGPLNIEMNKNDSTFALQDKIIDSESLKDGELLVQTIYLSNDPAQKDWINPTKFSYASPLPIGSVIPSRALVKVIESKSSIYQKGDYLNASAGWFTYAIINENAPLTFKVPELGIPPHHSVGAFGGTGLTAYFALYNYAELDEAKDQGKTFLISGAAGGVGSMAVSLASAAFKAKRIYAIAGGPEKVDYVESLGPNVKGIDYKDANFEQNLIDAVGEDKIDVILDNVGGKTLDLGLSLIKTFGKVVLIGASSGYQDSSKHQLANSPVIIFKRLTVKGFIVFDNVDEFETATMKLVQLLHEKKLDLEKLEFIEDATGRFDHVPAIWNGLFNGLNKGKFLTKLAQE